MSILLITIIFASGCFSAIYREIVVNDALKSTIKIEKKMNCLYSFIQSDSAEYDRANNLLKTNIFNTGTSEVLLEKYYVWYLAADNPIMWEITNPEKYNISINNNRTVVLDVGEGQISKVKIETYGCNITTTTITEPYSGWNYTTISRADAISAKRVS